MRKILPLLFLCISFTNLYSQHADKRYDAKYNLWENSGGYTGSAYDNMFMWQMISSGTSSSISDIFFTDTLNGWAALNGNGCMRSTNSGFNWMQTSFNDTSFTTSYNGIHFINANTGWCVGGSIQIRKTTNGGANWFKQYGPPVAGINNSVHFFDANTGFIIGRKTINFNSFMARTTNGGDNWTEIIVSTANNNELHSQFWHNASTGWICGRDILLYTSNGGADFTNLYANIPPTSNGANALLTIHFETSQKGWIGGSNIDKKNIYVTANGGANWEFQPNPVAAFNFTQINDMEFISPDSGWAAHGTPFSGAIMFTSNGGANWVVENGTSTWFDAINAGNRFMAWCGASSGQVWYTMLSSPTGIEGITSNAGEYLLSQNYPNPFNPSTVIMFSLAKESDASLVIYDALGKEVERLADGRLNEGHHQYRWNAVNAPAGIYYYTLRAGDFTQSLKMLLIK